MWQQTLSVFRRRLQDTWTRLLNRLLPGRRPGGPPPQLADDSAATAGRVPVPPRSVSVVIPALNEAARIASVVRHALDDPATAEVVVIDDSSIDDTATLARAAGARVVLSSMLGKGASMHDGIEVAQKDWLVYLDGDLAGLQPGIVTDLARPLAADTADFVKARFGRSGGRVTELTARPMLQVFFPELSRFAQPLGGLIAARRSLLRQLPFEDGYGVDVGLLIDAHRAGARLAEVDIGRVENDSQPLADLALMANEVSRVIYARARAAGRLHVDQIAVMVESQRQAAASLEAVQARRRGRTRLLLLGLDAVLTPEAYRLQVARAAGLTAELAKLGGAATADEVAAVFRFVHRRVFEQVAQNLVLRPGAIEAVNRLRREGFMVGVLAEDWFIGAEIVRRRVFADFALGHRLHFEGDVCTGQVLLNPAYAAPPRGALVQPPCRSHAVPRLRDDGAEPAVKEVWAVGAEMADAPLLRVADRALALGGLASRLARQPGVERLESLEALPGLALREDAQQAG